MLYILDVIFTTEIKEDANNYLTLEIFKNAESTIVQNLLYIYTMDSPIYPALNLASRTKDESKIMSLGQFACLL